MSTKMNDYSMYKYYKGSDEYPNKKAAFFGFYESCFERTYKGKPEDKEESFKDYMCNLLSEQASDTFHFPLQIGTMGECLDEYFKRYFDTEYKLEMYER